MIPEARRPLEALQQNGLEQSIKRYQNFKPFLALPKNTRLAYTADLAQFQEYCRIQGIPSINEMVPEDIRNWRDQLRQDGYAPATINRKVSSLSIFLGWARREGLFQTDLTDALVRSKIEKSQPRTLTSEQLETLISRAKNSRDSALILIALTTGASVTEIVNLNTEDILKTGDGNVAIRLKGIVQKTQSRKLEVDKKAGSKIAEYIEDSGLKPEDPLFKGFRDRYGIGRLTRQGVNFILKDYGHEIGVENLNPRMLRNTFILNFTGTPHQLDAVLGRKA